MKEHVTIIAEAGVNHNGDPVLARELVATAAEAGADIVKFQTFKAENLVTKKAQKATYQKENSGASESQYEMLKKLELSEELHFDLKDCCNKHSIRFLSTAFDSGSLAFLTKEVGLDILKIPSGEITNGPFLLEHARTGKNVIVSTGMATLKEVEEALAVLSHGYTVANKEVGSLKDCYEAFSSAEGQSALKEKVTLLHCTSQYPAPTASVNLRAMDTLASTFSLPVGYSDHTEGIIASVGAVAKGACMIEKHFTLDKNMEGPDHKASLEPGELKQLVQAIRDVETMLGSSVKAPDPMEANTREVARKSIVAAKDLMSGEVFSANNITIIRPGTGRSPMELWALLGKKADRPYQKGDLIK